MDDVSKIPEDLAKEIDDAINAPDVDDSTDNSASSEQPEKKDLPDDEVQTSDESDKDNGTDDEPDQPVITDSHIERAIKAGLSIADAKAFSSAESFERIVSMLESKNGGDDIPAAKTEEQSDEDFDLQLPELDPDEYDEKIVAGFKSMGDAIKRLLGENKALTEKVVSGGVSDFLSGKIQSAGESAIAKSDDIKKKFNVLEAGYKAAGESMSRDDVFNEAVSLVIGDPGVLADNKRMAAEKREGQLISRPTNVNRKKSVDTEQEVADMIDRKFFGKK